MNKLDKLLLLKDGVIIYQDKIKNLTDYLTKL